MKKYLILLIVVSQAIFTACNNDDDNVRSIVGNWILQNVEPSTVFDPAACTNNSTVLINGDNTLQANIYLEQNNCDGSSGNGTWENNANSSYTLNIPPIGEITGTVKFNTSDQFTFTAEDNTVYTFQRQL